jgi:hypothetical protein
MTDINEVRNLCARVQACCDEIESEHADDPAFLGNLAEAKANLESTIAHWLFMCKAAG